MTQKMKVSVLLAAALAVLAIAYVITHGATPVLIAPGPIITTPSL